MIDEQHVLKVRLEAAQIEREAATVRLRTAQREAVSAQKTIAMAEQVAQNMMDRQFTGGRYGQGTEEADS